MHHYRSPFSDTFLAFAAILAEPSSRIPGDAASSPSLKDRWLEEVDYRQAVTRHLSLWRERTADLKDILPKRHDLFVGVRETLDPAVDALETTALLSEMAEVDKRLEQAVLNFQPEKKRSILSIVSSNPTSCDTPASVASLDDFSSLAEVGSQVLKENVHNYNNEVSN